jgi:ABC-type transporter Mla subunit MlaD
VPNAATLRQYEDSVRTAAKTLSSKARQVGEKIPSSAIKSCKVADVANQALQDAEDALQRIVKQSRALAGELGHNAKIAEEYERAMVQYATNMNSYTAAMASYSSAVRAQASAPKGAKVTPPPPHPGGPPTEPVRPSFWSAN